MNRQAQGVILLLLGGAVVRASLTDLYLRYVKEGLRPFLIAAGLALVLTGVMTLWYDLRHLLPTRRGPDPVPGSDPAPEPGAGHGPQPGQVPGAEPGAAEHDHAGHHEPRVGWLLLLPVLGLLLVAPPALGSYAASQAGTTLTVPGDGLPDYPPLPATDPARITVLDYASRALFDAGGSLGQRRVQLTGFLTPGPGGQPILARMVLSCCAADGRPVKLGLTGEVPVGLPEDTWVEVVGRYSDRIGRDPVNDAEFPYLEVESWQQVPTPKQPYD